MATDVPAQLTRAARAERLRGIYLIVNEGGEDPLALAHAALDEGVRMIQYRAKAGIDPQRLRALRAATVARDALLIVNDDYRAALAFDADGVHLGPGDSGFEHVPSVRASLGERLIGLSCGTPAEALAAGDVDYIGTGSVYATASKADAGAPIGIDGLLAVARVTSLPVAAIGGIDERNIAAVREAGVAMAAVISAVASAANPREAARWLVAAWNEGRNT